MTLGSGQCTVRCVDLANEKDYWLGGDKPKVEVWLSADRDYYFKKSGKSAFKLNEGGDTVKYVSSSLKNDKEELVLFVTLEKLDEEDSDFSISGLIWDEEDLIRLNGQWIQDGKGWWYKNIDGSFTKNNWQYIRSKWYFFDEEGYMKTGWISWEDKLYYCADSGAMLVSAVTPDGFTVGADGSRIN